MSITHCLRKLKNTYRIVSFKLLTAAACCLLCFFAFACQPNQEILKSSATPKPPVEQQQDTFEKALGEVRSADFTYIYVFRRKDGGKFDSVDKKYVKDFSPGETNRFVLTDEERAVIAGSNFPFPPESLEALRLRFAVEDYSKPKTEESNANS